MRKIHKLSSEMLLLFNIRYNDNIYSNKIKQENHKYSKKLFNVIIEKENSREKDSMDFKNYRNPRGYPRYIAIRYPRIFFKNLKLTSLN